MPQISYAKLEGYWIAAGGPANVASEAAAIALAETGGTGNPKSKNPKDSNGFPSWGLWQINNANNTPPKNWSSPMGNARLAVAKYKGAGNSFVPWGTYTSGLYRHYLKKDVTPVKPSGVNNIVTTSVITSFAGGIFGGKNWQSTLERGGIIILGGVLILVGIWILAGGIAPKIEKVALGGDRADTESAAG